MTQRGLTAKEVAFRWVNAQLPTWEPKKDDLEKVCECSLTDGQYAEALRQLNKLKKSALERRVTAYLDGRERRQEASRSGTRRATTPPRAQLRRRTEAQAAAAEAD